MDRLFVSNVRILLRSSHKKSVLCLNEDLLQEDFLMDDLVEIQEDAKRRPDDLADWLFVVVEVRDSVDIRKCGDVIK